MTTKDELHVLLQNPIAFHRVFAEVGGGITAGLFLSQLFYWSGKGSDADGWVYKNHKEWTAETMLTRHEQSTCRRNLIEAGVVEEKLSNTTPPVVCYRIDYERLWGAIQSIVRKAYNQLPDPEQEEEPIVRKAYNQLPQNVQMIVRKADNLYNTEITTDTTTENTHTSLSTHAREGNPPDLTERATISRGPFIFKGKKAPTKKGSLPPDSVEVTEEGLAWAQEQGWRGDLAWLQRTAESCLDWGKGKNELRGDWYAVLRNWIKRTIDEGNDLPKQMHGLGNSLANVPQGQTNGQQRTGTEQGTGARRTGYGYNAYGEPTNRATAVVRTAEQLAQHQSERRLRLAREARGDAVPFSEHDGGSTG